MTPAMIAACKDRRLPKTAFFQIDLPDASRRIMLGAGEAKWGANTFKGYDSTFGQIDSTDNFSESNDGVAPNSSFTVIPAQTANRAVIAAPTVQLSRLRTWLAALTLDGSNHVVAVADPEPIFDGFIDQVTSEEDRGRDELTYTVISCFDYFFESGEGQRLNGAFHQSIWAGEKGLDNVTGIVKKVYWGALGPNSAGGVTTGGGGGGGGSVSGGGGGGGGSGGFTDRYGIRVN